MSEAVMKSLETRLHICMSEIVFDTAGKGACTIADPSSWTYLCVPLHLLFIPSHIMVHVHTASLSLEVSSSTYPRYLSHGVPGQAHGRGCRY